MVDIARLRKYAESVKDVRGALCELPANSMISILDQLDAAQKDAARYRAGLQFASDKLWALGSNPAARECDKILEASKS